MPATPEGEVGRTYTSGRRQPYLIRKWPGSQWVLPLGPYTITQLLVFVGSIYLLLTYRHLWAHFGPANLLIGAGVPAVLTYVTRHTRIEGRDPARAVVALAGLMTRPRVGYLGGEPVRWPRPVRLRCGHVPVAGLSPALERPGAAPNGAPLLGHRSEEGRPPQPVPHGRWVADLVADTARRRTGRPQ